MTSDRRSNRLRTAETRAQLLATARALFAEKGFHATGTPELVAATGLTRGALYHHFADKEALLAAVLEDEAMAVATHIRQQTAALSADNAGLQAGAAAYFEAMAVPGRARLLLQEGPGVLGPAAMAEIDRRTGGQTLAEGLAEALTDRHGPAAPSPAETLALADALAGAFDRAALAIAEGSDAAVYRAAVDRLIAAVVAKA